MATAEELSMEDPICLVEKKNKKLTVNQQALDLLISITKPVVVVMIIGRDHNGKSYLMNRLAGKDTGYSHGPSVQSQTKSIWMWCIDHPIKHDHVLVLLNTNRLGYVEKEDSKNDLWIFTLAILLSSTFVYNSMNTITHWDLEQMHYVTEVTKLIKVNYDDEDYTYSQEYLSRLFPDFVWVVHNFSQRVYNITPDEYLKHSLQFETGKNLDECKAILSRECFRRVFVTRKCFLFTNPENPGKIKIKLPYSNYIQESELVPEFKQQADNFCSYIFNNAKPKRFIENIMANGKRLGKLLEIYVNAMSSGSTLCLKNAILALAQTENSDAVYKATNHYVDQMILKVNYPTDTLQDLEKLHTDCKKEAIFIFHSQSFIYGKDKFWKELMEVLENQKNDFILRNEEESTKYCQTKLEDLSQTLMKAISQGTFSVPGGYKLYTEEREKMINNYHQEPRKGIKAEEVLQRYLQSLTMTEASILHTDQALTEQEKVLKAEQLKREAAEKLMEQQQMEMQQKMETQQRSYEENIKQLKKKIEEDRIQILRKQEMILDHKLKEQERLMNERFCEKAEKMKRHMEHLQTKIKEIENKKSSWWSTVLQTVGIGLMVLLPGAGKLIGLGIMALGKWTSK